MNGRLSVPGLVVVITIIACLLACAAPASAGKATELAGRMRTTYFEVRFDPREQLVTELLADVAHDELLRISKNLGYKPDPDRPFPLRLYPTHLSFIEAGGLQDSKFTVGTARSGTAEISIDASGALAMPKETIAHEITHAVVFRMLGDAIGELPLWFNEGLAKYESDEYARPGDEAVADAAGDGTLIPLTDLESKFPRDRINLAYAQSHSAMKYMVREHGKQAPGIVLMEMARTGSFDKAMMEATGKTGDRFASDWYAHTTAKYWGIRLSRVAMAVVSAVMAILAVAAFFVRRRQKIEAARRWEQEEFEEALRRQRGNDWWR